MSEPIMPLKTFHVERNGRVLAELRAASMAIALDMRDRLFPLDSSVVEQSPR